jgi:hypothetical protein
MYVKCRKCGSDLTGRIRYDHTMCPGCGKTWRLNAGHTAIYSTTVQVQSVVHEMNVKFISGDEDNGQSNA